MISLSEKDGNNQEDNYRNISERTKRWFYSSWKDQSKSAIIKTEQYGIKSQLYEPGIRVGTTI